MSQVLSEVEVTMDARTASQIRALGLNPDKLPPGTMIGGKTLAEAESEKPKQPKGPNKTERSWIGHLDWLVSIGKVQCYWYEPFNLRLTDPDPQTRRQTFYRPDFLVIMAKEWQLGDVRPRLVEIKGGHIFEDASVKFRLAMAAYYPAFRFSMVQKQKLLTWQTIAGETWIE